MYHFYRLVLFVRFIPNTTCFSVTFSASLSELWPVVLSSMVNEEIHIFFSLFFSYILGGMQFNPIESHLSE